MIKQFLFLETRILPVLNINIFVSGTHKISDSKVLFLMTLQICHRENFFTKL